MRCFPCHTPGELDPDNPKHKVPIERHRDFVKKYGAKMNLFQATPEQTLSRMIAGSRKVKPGRYPMINLADPAKSLLVLKPTAKLPPKQDDGTFAPPSSTDPVSHMGGIKMHRDDQSYKAVVTWLQDYAAVVGDQYASVEDLPADNWVATKRVLRVTDVPIDWGDRTVVQLFVHGRSEEGDGWG